MNRCQKNPRFERKRIMTTSFKTRDTSRRRVLFKVALLIIGIIAVSRTAYAQSVTLAGGPLNFGNVALNMAGGAQKLTLTNTLAAPLTLTLTFSGASPQEFQIVTGPGTCGASLAAGASCAIEVVFAPTV